MENNNEKNNIKAEVLSKIKQGRTIMKPRWYFVLESMAVLFAVILVSFVLLGLISFVLFTLKQNGAIFVGGFGRMGISVLARAMPWMLILFGFSLFVILEILMKNYAFAYRKPVLYSLTIIFFFVFFGSFIVHKARLHDQAFVYMSNHHIPLLGPMYLNYGSSEAKELHPGLVTVPFLDGFYMVKRSGREVQVFFVEQTVYPGGKDFAPGDNVVVLGIEEAGTIRAFGVRKVSPGFMPMHSNTPNFEFYAPSRAD